MKAIIFARVSTMNQDLEQQEQVLLQTAKADGYSDDNIIIISEHESAVKNDFSERLGLTKAKEAILTQDVNIIYAFELSRIARRLDVFYDFRKFLIEHKVQLKIINPQVSLLDKDGNIDENFSLVFSIFASLAEQEARLMKARFKRGKQKLLDNNLFTGGICPFGYSVNENKEYIINEKEAEIIRRIFKMYNSMTISDIAHELVSDGTFEKNVNSAQCLIRNILHRDYYTGVKTHYNGYKITEREYLFPQIIGTVEFKEAQEKIKERRKYYKTKSKCKYLCRGLIFNINDEYLRPLHCHNAYALTKIGKYKWETMSIKMDLIDEIAWYYTKKAITEAPKNLNVLANEAKQELAKLTYKMNNINSKIEEENKKLVRIEKRYIDGKITEESADELERDVQSKIDVLNRDKQQLESQEEALRKYLKNLSSCSNSHSTMNLDELHIDKKIQLVHEQIDKITVIKGKTQYDYVFGIQFKNHEYVIVDFNSQTKKLYDNGKVIEYEKTS